MKVDTFGKRYLHTFHMAVTFRIMCRNFRIMCRSSSILLDGANDEALPRRFHDLLRHLGQGVDLHEARNLCQQAMQETEVPARDPHDGRESCSILTGL